MDISSNHRPTRPDRPRERRSSIWILVDRSGSMAAMGDAVVEGIDGFVAAQVDAGVRTVVTIAQFDDHNPYELIVDRRPLHRVPSIADRFVPRGVTPLYDAIGHLLDHAERAGRGEDRLVVIMTDGHENASRRYRRDDIFRRITALRERGWTFVFLGANQDSYAVGRALGFAEGSVSNFVGDGPGARIVCESFARGTRDWAERPTDLRRQHEGEFFGGRKEAEDDLAIRHRQ